jgi:hypothetical protein
MFLLPRVSFRCRRFRCSHETAIELKVLLANKKLMLHCYLLEGMDRIAHCAQEREGRGRIICRNDRGRTTTSLGKSSPTASCHQHALMSLKRLAERQAVESICYEVFVDRTKPDNSVRLPDGREHATTGHTTVRSGKPKRKPFNSNVTGHLLTSGSENPRREPAGFAMPFRSHPTLKFSADVFPLLGTSS